MKVVSETTATVGFLFFEATSALTFKEASIVSMKKPRRNIESREHTYLFVFSYWNFLEYLREYHDSGHQNPSSVILLGPSPICPVPAITVLHCSLQEI